jgi:hypothetical protein
LSNSGFGLGFATVESVDVSAGYYDGFLRLGFGLGFATDTV